MNLPKGYVVGAQLANGSSEHIRAVEHETPAGYKKARAPKRDEHNPRPPRFAGPKKVCQCCYRSSHEIYDYVCKRCLKDRRELALVEREIAKEHPRTMGMTSGQILKRVWKALQASQRRVKELRSKNAKLADDLACLTGDD